MRIPGICNGYRGFCVERKAVGRNLSLLKEAGFDIASGRSGCYLDSREFEVSELKLLIDGVLCSQHINPGNRHTDKIAAALSLLLCRPEMIPAYWFRKNTSITAEIRLQNTLYTVSAKPRLDQLQLLAVDPTGADVTTQYQYLLSHCREQDDVEAFDGKNRSIPHRLCHYFDWENHRDLSSKTWRLADTKTFRRHLRQYINNFQPEPIHCKKATA